MSLSSTRTREIADEIIKKLNEALNSKTRKLPDNIRLSEDLHQAFSRWDFIQKWGPSFYSVPVSLGPELPPETYEFVYEPFNPLGDPIGTKKTPKWNSIESDMMRRKTVKAIAQHEATHIAEALFEKVGGMPFSDSVERLLSYVENQVKIPFTDVISSRDEGTNQAQERHPDVFLDDLKKSLMMVAGVTDMKVIFENFPDEASIIINTDMHMLSDSEASDSMTTIDRLLRSMKPRTLTSLEVIYHHKERY